MFGFLFFLLLFLVFFLLLILPLLLLLVFSKFLLLQVRMHYRSQNEIQTGEGAKNDDEAEEDRTGQVPAAAAADPDQRLQSKVRSTAARRLGAERVQAG